MSSENGDVNNQQLLTAYALGELDEADRASVEARLASDPEVRGNVDEVRAMARLLTDELANEPTAGLASDQRAAVEGRLAYLARSEAAGPNGAPRGSTSRRWLVGGFAAAAAVLLVAAIIQFLAPSLNRAREVAVSPGENPYRVDRTGSYPSDRSPQTYGGVRDRVAQRPAADVPASQRWPNATGGPQVSGSYGMSRGMGYPGGYPGMGYPMAGAPAPAAPGGYGGYPGRASGGGYSGMGGMYANSSGGTAVAPAPSPQASEFTTAPPVYVEPSNTEAYDGITDSGFLRVADHPLSTFSIDVDTASYSNVRRYLNGGALPPKDAVRIEELVNYFPYRYAPPKADDAAPFAAHIEVAGCPWDAGHRLVRVGLKGREIARDKRPPSNLVFLVDVSGSMEPENKLPLVKQGLRLLVRELNENDRVAIVVYAGSSGLALPPTTGDQKGTLLGAIDALGAGGSTNGAGGIERAYEVAAQNFRKGGVNRVLLCTDGDFNVGITDTNALTRLIEEKAKSGVFLSVLGFGMGNLKDATMEKLADRGNGNYAYVDNLSEARKVLVEQMSGTLVTIAKDVKTQVEFNPAKVSAYRLVGYENRLLRKEDFNDDAKDAGEIGAGHTVTALYEVVPAGGAEGKPGGVDELKYQKPAAAEALPAAPPAPASAPASDELLTVKLRYKEPDGATSRLLEFPVTDGGATYARASQDFKFAASVAGFGMVLRDSPHKGTATFASVLELAEEGVGADEGGYRAEFITLVQKAQALSRK